ncbi:MAG: hypothetical protein WBC92_04110, partial [Terracidiphilus sp.]
PLAFQTYPPPENGLKLLTTLPNFHVEQGCPNRCGQTPHSRAAFQCASKLALIGEPNYMSNQRRLSSEKLRLFVRKSDLSLLHGERLAMRWLPFLSVVSY